MPGSSPLSTLIRRVRNTIWYTTPLGPNDYQTFRRRSRQILKTRMAQTQSDVEALAQRYREPIFGDVKVWGLLQRMREVVDPTDTRFGNVDQMTHTLQVLESMEDAEIEDDDMRLAALLHDLGKLLSLVGEAPENVFGMKSPLGAHRPGVGLDNVLFQWNHDDFIYDRFNGLVSEPVAWLLRYHSIVIRECLPCMDAQDRDYTDRYLRAFQVHDQDSKSIYRLPRRRIEDYRDWIEARFPDPIQF